MSWNQCGGVVIEGTNPCAKCKPVVVIDPEDSRSIAVEIAQRVGSALHIMPGRDISAGIEAVQAALREFANPGPPKPEEPTGLGAVVEDASGERWVRSADGHWHDGRNGTTNYFTSIKAVRVLSEGLPD